MKPQTWRKLDKKIFNFYSRLVVNLVTKLKHKKHKFHIYKYFHYAKLPLIFIYYACAVISISLGHGGYIPTASFLACLFIFFWFWQEKSNTELIKMYDPLFQARKNPAVYKMMKTEMAALFKRGIYARNKGFLAIIIIAICICIFWVAFLAGAGWSFFGLILYFSYDIFMDTFIMYNYCVFDFEKPKKKSKKKKEAEMTDFEKRRWRDVLKFPKPKPFPI